MIEVDTIKDGKVVALHYILTNANGDVLDQSDEGEPLLYLHGAENIVPGLENALTGHKTGERLTVRVEPAEGYGERIGPGPQAVGREAFPDGLDVMPGMQFFTEGPDGNPMPVWVTEVQAEHIYLDINHPLAGETLIFDVTVDSIRDATESEMTHGHPHGADGMHVEDDDFEDEEYDDEDFEDEEEEEEEDENDRKM